MATKPNELKSVPHVDNVTMLNTMRYIAQQTNFEEFTNRIPEATRDNINDIYNSIMNFSPRNNPFIQLIGRIGMTIFSNNIFFNPLRGFKRGKLERGEYVQEIITNLVKGFQFDPEKAQTDLYNYQLPDVRQLFHELNYTLTYKTTTFSNDLENAFLSNYGISEMITNIVETLTVSGEYDEYISMRQVIDNFIAQGLAYPVTVQAVTDETSAKALLTNIRAWAKKIAFPSTNYNPLGYSGLYSVTRPKNVVLITTPEVDATLDVQALAAVFNIDYANIEYSKVVIDKFNDKNVQAMLVDRDVFMFFDKYYEMDSVWNPQGRYFNHILNIGEIMSYTLFKNVIAFTTETTTVTSVKVNPPTITMNKGDTRTFTAGVTGTGIISQNCSWSITGNAKPETKITDGGVLTIASDETAETITVTAISLVDTAKSGNATVTVAGNP